MRLNRYELTNSEIGEITERKLIAAAIKYKASWLIRIERAPVEWDMRKVDARAYIRCRNDTIVMVPIQVKSTEILRQQFIVECPDAVREGIIPITVRLQDNDVNIYLKLYQALIIVRNHNKECHPTLVQRLALPAAGKGIEYCRRNERTRMLNPSNPHKLDSFSIWSWLVLCWKYL